MIHIKNNGFKGTLTKTHLKIDIPIAEIMSAFWEAKMDVVFDGRYHVTDKSNGEYLGINHGICMDVDCDSMVDGILIKDEEQFLLKFFEKLTSFIHEPKYYGIELQSLPVLIINSCYSLLCDDRDLFKTDSECAKCKFQMDDEDDDDN